jgi:hypothetical protein
MVANLMQKIMDNHYILVDAKQFLKQLAKTLLSLAIFLYSLMDWTHNVCSFFISELEFEYCLIVQR